MFSSMLIIQNYPEGVCISGSAHYDVTADIVIGPSLGDRKVVSMDDSIKIFAELRWRTTLILALYK